MEPSPVRDRNVAILMDFENTKDASLQRILASAAAFGQVIIRRAYADWTRHANAHGALREAGFEAVHQFTTGHGSKNATDIQLTVDAMDFLWSRPVDVFVLVTADSDFAKLAMRLREGGKMVVGIGNKERVGRSLVQACDQYIYYDEGAQKSSRRKRSEKPAAPPKKEKTPATKIPAKSPQFTDLHRIVISSLEAAADEDGWVYGSPLHRSIKRLFPDFSYQDHGFSSFRTFIESLAPVISTETDKERSDFLVWIEEVYEDAAWQFIEAGRGPTERTSAPTVLTEEVQRRLDEAWRSTAANGRLSAKRAADAVALEYGVDRISETPFGSLDKLLEASPLLSKAWRRDGRQLVYK
jgi:uncharacterized protein (TIGR00288 family)